MRFCRLKINCMRLESGDWILLTHRFTGCIKRGEFMDQVTDTFSRPINP